ncbi:uncharacterized protein [Littorina saxatilis]|uniref:uncharacterized protein isoform X2 n=1 Tax=Littorina saxatilis TaxID=31220 RepID=UPI0038B48BB9
MTAHKEGFDYRPYILCCCPSLQVLDGYVLNDSERQQAQWLYQQGYIHHILPGQHLLMVRYLATVCPLTSLPQLQSEQDVYVSRILNKQQEQLQQHNHQWPHNNLHLTQGLHVDTSEGDTNNSTTSVPLSSPGRSKELHTNSYCTSAWTGRSTDRSVVNGGIPHKGEERHDLSVQDLGSEDCDARSSTSLLESESVYLPVSEDSPPTPQPTPQHTLFAASHPRQPVSSHPHTSPAGNLQSALYAATVTRFSVSSPSGGLSGLSPAGGFSGSNPSRGFSGLSPAGAFSGFSPAGAFSVSIPRVGVSPSHSPATSRTQTSPETKYESRERRVIRPFNQEISQGKLKTKFTIAKGPQPSDAEPTTHTSRSEHPPTAHSQDYDMSLDTSSRPSPLPDHTSSSRPLLPQPKPSTASVAAAHVGLIHRVADSRRSAREQQLQQQETMRHTPPPSGPVVQTGSQIPTSQSKSSRARMKGLDSNRQAELSKLVKCQQNAERLNQHRDRGAPGLHLSTDSGFQSRPASDAVLSDYGQEGQTAATLIQSVWRGYWAREHSLDVVSVRKEIRARRAEDHILLLRAQLDRHKKLYNEEKRLRTLQMEAIRALYHEVQQLKTQVHAQSSAPNSRPGTADSMLSSAPLHLGTASSFNDSQRTAELERTCQSLQSQVSELQQALQSMTTHVFRQDSLDYNSLSSAAETDCLSSVQVQEYHDNQNKSADPQSQPTVCHWSSIPHSLSPYPSEEEEMYFRQVPHHGAPTPPRNLTLQHKGEHSVLLQWLPSRVSIDHSAESRPTVVAYRVYINDQVKGTVSNHKSVALVSGLLPSATYKFYIKAFSGSGESFESNIVIARLARGSERQRPTDSSDSDVLPDSDKDRDSSDVIDKRRLRKRENRKHRKVRSPRSEKKLPRTSGETKEGEESLGSEEGGRQAASSGGHHHHQPVQESPEEGAVGILTQPTLHKHRRTRSKEQNEVSSLTSDSPGSTPSRQGDDSRPPSRTTHTPSRELSQTPVMNQRRAGSPARDLSFKSTSPSLDKRGGDRSSPGSQDGDRRKCGTPPVLEAAPPETPVVLSETFTVDMAKSYLHNLDGPLPSNSAAAPAEDEGGSVKGHQRKRSKDLNQEGGLVPAAQKDRSSPASQVEGAGEEGGKIRTHRRNRSRDLNTPTPMDDARKGEEEAGGGGGREREPCSTPVLDGRRRTNSRPSSPMIFEGPAMGAEHRDTDSVSAEMPRRMTTAENLIQRVSGVRKSPSPSSVGGSRDTEEGGEKRSPQHGNRSRRHSPSPDSLPDSQDENPPRPLSLRHRTRSVGSEGDLVGAVSGRKDKEASIVSTLLAKMESTLRETTSRLRKRSSEEEERRRPSGRARHVSESDNDMSSDPGSHLPPRAPAASDSSSPSHSDDNKARSHRHRRSPSDQRPLSTSGYNSDQVTGRATHSPIIMEGSKKGSNNVRRNASFHALLPSRPPDSQPSPAPEEMASGGAAGGRREEVTSPQVSSHKP